MSAAAIAAILIRKEHDLVAHMRLARATTASAAKSPDELGVETRLPWSRLVRRSVIREVSGGRFYLDEPAWEAFQQRRRGRVGVVLAAVILTMIALYLWSRGASPAPSV